VSRVLILTASYGEGHNAAARSLAAAFDRWGGDGTAQMLDPLATVSPRRDKIARAVYYRAINHLPRVWSAFYAWLDRSRPLPDKLGLLQEEMRWLEQQMLAAAPSAVCSTYPIFAFMLDYLARARCLKIPSYNVVTDSISINSMWWLAPCDGWFLPNEESAQVLRDAGCAAEKLRVMGFPVDPIFALSSARLSRPQLSEGERPKVLFIIHSGSRGAMETARLLLEQTDWTLTFAVGRDQSLRRRITQRAAGRIAPVEVLGWTDRIPELLMTHHAVISKAGGATTQEAIAAHCPMVVNQVIPGQEEGNYELLRRHDIGGRAETPRAVLQLLQRGFADGGREWRGWHLRVQNLARPSAATDIAQFVLRRHRGHTYSPSELTRPETFGYG